ncbi:hypothetical protein pEaSNUABM5_00167 [Erwinia phage pEa_SNUABM_5]|uniref:J domain-containing protein n=1 Tax=Erwinia phage pEa_SNUABM_5 TaxID=2797313 RepID=A0A7T8EPI4_9CAUD|nr:hypothetical protein MPK73_gp167 [Erwinia phage pEa_SNUABM_5]QQO90309.1 hypothetical protein pEaSNUABM5_00167 [Erwinia phage pEa_SNUABM_5]
MTQLMVLDEHQLQVHGDLTAEPDVEQDIPDDHEYAEEDQNNLQYIEEEIVTLTEVISDDRERIRVFIAKVDCSVKEENDEISQLAMQINMLQQDLAHSDDIEDQQAAKEADDVLSEYDLESEDDDAPNRHADLELEEEYQEDEEDKKERRLIKKIFILITLKTHPDKCGNTSKLHYYRDAVADRDRGNLYGLKSIYKKVYGHEYGKSSLFDRLETARRRRDQLRQELSDIRSTGAWQMYQINLEHDYPTAVRILRENLRFQITAMRTMLSELQQRRNWM